MRGHLRVTKQSRSQYADIGRLFVGELGELDADLVEMQPGDFLVAPLRQPIDLLLVLAEISGGTRKCVAGKTPDMLDA